MKFFKKKGTAKAKKDKKDKKTNPYRKYIKRMWYTFGAFMVLFYAFFISVSYGLLGPLP